MAISITDVPGNPEEYYLHQERGQIVTVANLTLRMGTTIAADIGGQPTPAMIGRRELDLSIEIPSYAHDPVRYRKSRWIADAVAHAVGGEVGNHAGGVFRNGLTVTVRTEAPPTTGSPAERHAETLTEFVRSLAGLTGHDLQGITAAKIAEEARQVLPHPLGAGPVRCRHCGWDDHGTLRLETVTSGECDGDLITVTDGGVVEKCEVCTLGLELPNLVDRDPVQRVPLTAPRALFDQLVTWLESTYIGLPEHCTPAQEDERDQVLELTEMYRAATGRDKIEALV